MLGETADEEEIYTVIPTAPEDIPFESSCSKSSSPASVKPSARSNPVTFTGRPSNGTSSHLSKNEHPGYQQKTTKESKKKDGLPSHAFSRNYYCRYCPFNTTKSKVHLYHLVDVHGVDYKIFSCDRCDYASRWKCKVIRHRKMIHKINEPKFEPDVHDSRSQTGKRPPPLPIPPESQQPQRVQSPQFPSDNRPTFPAQSYTSNNQPAFAQPYSQGSSGLPVNPFVNKRQQDSPIPSMKREDSSALSGNEMNLKSNQEFSSRRKQRKPQLVRKVVKDGDEQVYQTDKLEPVENFNGTSKLEPGEVLPDESMNKGTEENQDDPLFNLFGNVSDSGNSSSVFGGASWRKRLMPTAVSVTTNRPTAGSGVSAPSEDDIMAKFAKTSPISSTLLKPSLTLTHKEHVASQNQPSNQVYDDNSMDDVNLLKDKCVEEMMIDDEPHYRCTECNFISKFRWKTSKHYKANHTSSKLFKCTVCDFSTPNRVEFFSHKATHSSRGMHKCDECSYVAASKTNLDRHMVNHRLNNPIKCLYCSFSSTGEAAIQRHMAEHHDQSETPLALRNKYASVMDESSNQDEGITNGDGEYNCELCGYTARNWSKMKEHMIRHSEGTPFACSYCDSKYKRPADLNRHLKIKHNTCLADIGLDGPTLKGVLTPYQEGVMDTVGSSDGLNSMKRACPSDSNQDSMQDSLADGDSESDDPKRLCIDEDGGNLQCPKCSYLAKWKSDLERHMKVHSEEKRFSCPVCYKSYKYQGDLNVHMRRAHAASHIRTPKQSGSGSTGSSSTTCKTPPPNVQVLSNEVIVNMSHAAIVNPLANLGPLSQSTPQSQDYQMPSLTAAPQMPTLKPAPTLATAKKTGGGKDTHTDKNVKYDADGKRIKKGELDPATMVHVPGGEFKCLNCCYETNFKSHLDAHMRLHPEKPFHCMFCNYASYWRGDTKKHIEKNHPEKLPSGINPYNLVEQVFEEAVRNSPNRHKPLPEVHNVPPKNTDNKSDRGTIWTPPNPQPPNEHSVDNIQTAPTLTPAKTVSPSSRSPKPKTASDETTPGQVQCPHCNYTTSSESRLNAHMATHYNLKIYKCPACGKRANWKWDVQKHMRQEHPGETDEVICMDTEEARETLDEYLKEHPEQRGKPRVSMPANFRPEHWPRPRDMTSSSKTTSIRPFRCSVCSRRSNWKCDIRKHYRQVHPQRIDAHVELMTKEELLAAGEKEDDVEQHYPEMKSKGNGSAFRPYRCSLCGKNSRWKWDVTKHIKMVHRGITDAYVIEDEEPENPATPDTSVTDGEYENTMAPSPGSNKIKSRASPDPRPMSKHSNGPKIGCYQCSECSQLSEFMWVIRRHIRSLHPNHPEAKVVDLSGKGDESAVSDSRPYICSLCGKRSNWKWDVKKHILSVHKGNIGSILDELLNKETVIYTDGKTMEVDGNAREKIAEIQSHMKEEGVAASLVPAPSTNTSSNNNCYSSLPTMVGLNSAIAPSPDPSSQGEMSNGSTEASPAKNDSFITVKFKCGYCFYTSSSRNETVRHVRSEHSGKILRIQTLNRQSRDEQTTYKAAHRSSATSATYSMWQCSQCSFKHAKKDEALAHIQSSHDLFNAYQCALCDFGDDMEFTLHKHIKAKHEVENVEEALLQNIAFVQCSDDGSETSVGITFSCNQCEMKTAWRSAIVRHIREKHIVDGDINTMFSKIGTTSKLEINTEQNRRYNCTICPYKTDKVSMFNDHMERHSPKPDSELKCQFCDYWVSAPRFLNQHMRLHQNEFSSAAAAAAYSPQINGDENSRESSRSDRYVLTGGLAQCPDCPYRGKTKDLNAHRRLHKERPGAEFKCPECPYWVTQSRLLQQHAKVHSPSYRQRDFTNSLRMVDPSSDEIAAFKQHLISNQVNSIKLESEDGSNKLSRKLHQCSKCPFATSKLPKLEEHDLMHGAVSENALKCKFCDYYCDNRDLMAQHIKVHSLQYEGEIDDDEVLSEKNQNSVDNDESDESETTESGAGFNIKQNKKNGEITLEKQKRGLASRKYCCEKCSYCSAYKENFKRHMDLHGSKLGHKCTYCDYSVPTAELLSLHEELHKKPNKNLLATQSIMNLTQLKPVSADIQLAQSAELVDGVVTDVHDHIDLHENLGSKRQKNDDGIMDDDNDNEPEFIDLAELGSKVTHNSSDENDDDDNDSSSQQIEEGHMMEIDDDAGDMEMEDGEEVWICRYCDRAFDSEVELTDHEKKHSS